MNLEFETLRPIQGGKIQLVSMGGRTLRVSPLMLQVIEGVRAGLDHAEIAAGLNRSGQLRGQVDAAFVGRLIDAQLAPLLAEPGHDKRSEIRGRIDLLSPSMIERLCAPLRPLFASYPRFYTLLLFNLLLSAVAAPHVKSGLQMSALSWHSPLLMILAMFLCMLFHEFGHAAAALRFGVRPRAIGTGLLMFFPVLYTDVSEIWCLPPRKRLVINLAGVHVQLLINVGLLLTLLAAGDSAGAPMLRLLFLANAMSVLLNLVPFFRLDGYWVLTDLLGADNLQSSARGRLLAALAFFMGRGGPRPRLDGTLVYALLWLLALGLMVSFALRLVISVGFELASTSLQPRALWMLLQESPMRYLLAVLVPIALVLRLRRMGGTLLGGKRP